MKNTYYLNDRLAGVLGQIYSERNSTKMRIEDVDGARSVLDYEQMSLVKVARIYGSKNGGKKVGLYSRYEFNYRVVLKNGSGEEFVVLLSIFPHCKQHRFLRFEFNPRKAKRSGCVLLNALLRYWLKLGNGITIHDVAFLKRVDLCRDSCGDLNDFYPYYPKPTVSEIFSNKKSGRLETFVIGAKESSNRKIVYDKGAESLSKGMVLEGVIRSEQQFTHLNIPFSEADFEFFVNRVGRMKYYSSDLLDDSGFSPEFKYDVQLKGINYALGMCGATRKRRYRRILDSRYLCDPFNHSGREVSIKRLADVLNVFKREK